MARLDPPAGPEPEGFAERFAVMRQVSGYVPNSMLTMALRPKILEGVLALGTAVMLEPGAVPRDLKWMIAHIVSNAAGCRYCQAHTAHNAHRAEVPAEKVDALWSYDRSPLFSAAEKAALDLALVAGQVPNGATDAHFAELKKHFDDGQIVEIVSVISLFGWFNRWNDTMATDLEQDPLRFAEGHLSAAGWEPGNHGGG
ncbi:carboxymuconolactone decarboxylase family protein [Marinibaculum pumilum]|uniref:Carboxymuconolactone decarboxylase family protein n=1 Tax=Marinibaculum pumilum TaxID=1766165 RepID=A0ABV7L997_9PROT